MYKGYLSTCLCLFLSSKSCSFQYRAIWSSWLNSFVSILLLLMLLQMRLFYYFVRYFVVSIEKCNGFCIVFCTLQLCWIHWLGSNSFFVFVFCLFFVSVCFVFCFCLFLWSLDGFLYTGVTQSYWRLMSRPLQQSEYHNKVKWMFWFASAYKRYVYTTL